MAVSYTGNSSPHSQRMYDLPPYALSSDLSTPNSLAPRRLWNMSGRRILESPAPSLNSESDFFGATTNEIGTPSGSQLSAETWRPLTPVSVSSTTVDSNRLPLITSYRWLSRRLSPYFGALLVWESQDVHGTRPDWTPTPRTREPSFGADMAANSTSLWTNSAAASTWRTSSVGLTGIQLPLRRRVRPLYLGPVGSGLRPTSLPNSGFRDLTPQLLRRYCDEW